MQSFYQILLPFPSVVMRVCSVHVVCARHVFNSVALLLLTCRHCARASLCSGGHAAVVDDMSAAELHSLSALLETALAICSQRVVLLIFRGQGNVDITPRRVSWVCF